HSPSNPSNLLFGTNFFFSISHSPPIVPSFLQTPFLIVRFLPRLSPMYLHSVLVTFQVFEVLLLKDFRLNESFYPSRFRTIFQTQAYQFLHLLRLKYVLPPVLSVLFQMLSHLYLILIFRLTSFPLLLIAYKLMNPFLFLLILFLLHLL